MNAATDAKPEVLITDMSCAVPTDGWVADLSYGPMPPRPAGGWRILDYSCKEYDGRMLTTCLTDAAVLRIPLRLTGWHAVCLGISVPRGGEGILEVRLTGQKQWQRLRVCASGGFSLYGPDCALLDYWQERRVLFDREEPWIMADLTGCDLEIRPPGNLFRNGGKGGWTANLMSVRAIPMAAGDVRRITEEKTRQLAYINDGHGIFWLTDHPGPATVEAALQPFADSDWNTCCFGVDVSIMYTEDLVTGDGWDMYRSGDRFAAKFAAPLAEG